jgi:hypothetical protein
VPTKQPPNDACGFTGKFSLLDCAVYPHTDQKENVRSSMNEIPIDERFQMSYVSATGKEGMKELYGRSSNYMKGSRLN